MQIIIVQHAVHQGQYWNVSRNAGVFSARNVRDGEEVWQADHPVRHSKAELLDLVTNIVKECIARPVSYQHDCENRDAAKYMAMADLDRMECVPISFVLYPRVSLPMKQTMALRQLMVILDVTCFSFPWEVLYVLTGIKGPVSGYDRIHFTIT
jgi:hypothetical protein